MSAQSFLYKRFPWICFGDFQKAFPNTDRSDLLSLLFSGALVRDGIFTLLEDILKHDHLNIWLSGECATCIDNGIPEGGALGPAFYNLIPDCLLKELVAAGFGVGINFSMPAAWTAHVWHCSGSPDPVLTQMLISKIKAGEVLPSSLLMQSWPTLEASAARALDTVAPQRIVLLLHADDPMTQLF